MSGTSCLDEVWGEHRSRLRAYIGKRIDDSDACDDILHDVYLKAFTALEGLRSPGSITAWLFRITANAVADHHRLRRHEELPDEFPAAVPQRDHAGELSDCIMPLLESLPEKYRSALMLSEIRGLPHREVARIAGISLSGAKSRVQRGREMLRALILECCRVETCCGSITGFEPRTGQCCGA